MSCACQRRCGIHHQLWRASVLAQQAHGLLAAGDAHRLAEASTQRDDRGVAVFGVGDALELGHQEAVETLRVADRSVLGRARVETHKDAARLLAGRLDRLDGAVDLLRETGEQGAVVLRQVAAGLEEASSNVCRERETLVRGAWYMVQKRVRERVPADKGTKTDGKV